MQNIAKFLDRVNQLFRSNSDRFNNISSNDGQDSNQQAEIAPNGDTFMANARGATATTPAPATHQQQQQQQQNFPRAVNDGFGVVSNGIIRMSSFPPPLPSPSSDTPSMWPTTTSPSTPTTLTQSNTTTAPTNIFGTPNRSNFSPPTSIQLDSHSKPSNAFANSCTVTPPNSNHGPLPPLPPLISHHPPPPKPSFHHPSLAASLSQPMMPVNPCSSTSSSNSSTPMVDCHKNSYSAVQTPDSPIGFPRRQYSLTVTQSRTSANSLHLDLKNRNNSASCSNELSLSPRPRPRNLGLSNSQDNMFRNNSSQHQQPPPQQQQQQSSSHHRARPNAFMPFGNQFQHHQQPSRQSQVNPGLPPSPLSHHGYYPGKLNETFKKNNETLTINGVKYENVQETDFVKISELGSGSFGNVEKMLHKISKTELAVKIMRRSGNIDDNRHIMNDLELLTKCLNFPHIVQCYGYYIMPNEVWIFMELMATCFDRLLKKLKEPIPENIIGKIAVTTVSTLDYLKTKHEVIHRDVKPSNILINRDGIIKLCDFGISGHLIESIAYTRSVGCAAYMAPERIEPPAGGAYDIRSDVWSLGISLVEIATGEFPYKSCTNEFAILTQIVNEEPPTKLIRDNGRFSSDFCDFIAACLTKDYRRRPKYNRLLETPFLLRYRDTDVDVGEWFRSLDI